MRFSDSSARRGLVLAVTLYLLAGLGIAASFLLQAPLPVWCAAIAALVTMGCEGAISDWVGVFAVLILACLLIDPEV